MEPLDESATHDSAIALRWFFHLVLSWAWLIVLIGGAAGGVAYYIASRMTPTYRASTRLLVSTPATISGLDPTTGLVTSQTLTSTYAEMLLDRSVLEGVIEQLKLAATPEELKGSISVSTVPNTQLLTVTVDAPHAKLAADVANSIATVFTARIQNLRSQRYASIREGLAGQVTDMEQQIATTSDKIAAIQQELAADASQRAAAMQTQSAVAATQMVASVVPQQGPSATQTVTAIQQQIAIAATQAVLSMPATAEPVALVQLQEQLTQYRTLYSNLVLTFQQVRLAEEQTSSSVTVSESAAVPTKPVSPNIAQITLLGVLVGMILAAGIVIAAERMDDTIRDPEEIWRKFGLRILGVIPRHQAQEGRKPIVLAEPRSLVTEAFRSLRTNIACTAMEPPLRRILVTSAVPQDGKTTVACNLAAVVSQNEKRVLLIDADLRRPQIRQRLGLHTRRGLTDILADPQDDFGSALASMNPSKLEVLTSGHLPAHPAELLSSHLMGKTLDALGRDFGLIVIDTPPLLTVADAATLSSMVDGVILVARPGKTKLGAFRRAVEQLEAVRAHLLGVVLNEVDTSNRRYGHYYGDYYSKYSYYYQPAQPPLARFFGSLLGGKDHRRAVSAQRHMRPRANIKRGQPVSASQMEQETVVPNNETTVAGSEDAATAQPEAVAGSRD